MTIHPDPIVEAAFALNGRPGAYAVLLGSGVSSGAGILTGWEIMADLIGRLAAVTQEEVPSDPEAWYIERYESQPTYSGLLERLGRTNSEREAIIRSYVEPSAEAAGRLPTAAHHALAQLAEQGLIKVFLTTNFDRLLEDAFTQRGIVPSVWATSESVSGGVPLIHAGVVIVKLHGDYLDPGIKNTPDELGSYDSSVDQLLDRVFSDFGLFVCGWSADHDTALRRALERSRTNRFSCWWTTRSPLTGTALRLAEHCTAEIVSIESADTYFEQLARAASALSALNRLPPTTVGMAVTSAKQELDGDHRAIKLHDQIRDELQRVAELPLYTPGRDYPQDEHLLRLNQVAAESELSVALVAVASYWGNGDSDEWWLSDIERLGRRVPGNGGMYSFGLPRVPGLAILWSGGVAASAARRFGTLSRLLIEPQSIPEYSNTLDTMPAAVALTPEVLHIAQDATWVFRVLRRAFVQHLGIGQEAYVAAWERWQTILLAYASDLRITNNTSTGSFSPYIRVDCPFALDNYSLPAAEELRSDVMRHGTQHGLLQSGLFGGSVARFQSALDDAIAGFLQRAKSLDESLLGTQAGFSSMPSGLHYPGTREGRSSDQSIPEP